MTATRSFWPRVRHAAHALLKPVGLGVLGLAAALALYAHQSRAVVTVPKAPAAITVTAISGDGRFAAVGSRDGGLVVQRTDGGALLRIANRDGPITGLVFDDAGATPGKTRLLYATALGRVRGVDPATGEAVLAEDAFPESASPALLARNVSGAVIMAGSDMQGAGFVAILRPGETQARRSSTRVATGSTGAANAPVVLSPLDGDQPGAAPAEASFVVAYRSGGVVSYAWRGDRLSQSVLSTNMPNPEAFNLARVALNDALRRSGSPIASLPGGCDAAIYVHRAESLVVLGRDGSVCEVTASKHRLWARLPGVLASAVGLDANHVLLGFADGRVRTLDMKTLRMDARFGGHGGAATHVAFAAGRAVVGAEDGSAQIINLSALGALPYAAPAAAVDHAAVVTTSAWTRFLDRVAPLPQQEPAPSPVVADASATAQKLRQLMPELAPDLLNDIARAADATLPGSEINTPLRMAHFWAQAAHEISLYKRDGVATVNALVEASGVAYEGRFAMGNTQPGDGERYRGRGVLGLTGKINYRLYGQALGLDLEANPDLAARPDIAVKVGLEYWRRNNLNRLADADNLEAETRRINGGLNGLENRRRLLVLAKSLWSVDGALPVAAEAEAAGSVYVVSASGLNLRAAPDAASEVLVVLPRGQFVTRLDAKSYGAKSYGAFFVRVTAELHTMKFEGYATAAYLQPLNPPPSAPRRDLTITEADIIALARNPRRELLPGLVAALNRYMPEYEVNTPLRVSHFMAQAAHESGNFRYLQEPGNDAYFQMYEGRAGLGNTEPGDGARYKGRGIFQLTGRSNYRSYGEAIGIDLENNPDLAATPEVAARVTLEYWRKYGMNALADADDIEASTRRINGGLNGLEDRRLKLRIAKGIWGGKVTQPVAGGRTAPGVPSTTNFATKVPATSPATGATRGLGPPPPSALSTPETAPASTSTTLTPVRTAPTVSTPASADGKGGAPVVVARLVPLMRTQLRIDRAGGHAVVLFRNQPAAQTRNRAACEALWLAFDESTYAELQVGVIRGGSLQRGGDGTVTALRPIFWPTDSRGTNARGDRCTQRLQQYDYGRAATILDKIERTGPGPYLVVSRDDQRQAAIIDMTNLTTAQIPLMVQYFRDRFSQQGEVWSAATEAPQARRAGLLDVFGPGFTDNLVNAISLFSASAAKRDDCIGDTRDEQQCVR